MRKQRICLVSPGHVASNPRLVKEADALHDAGFQVRVVACDITPVVRPLDETVLAKAAWRCVRVGRGSKLGYTVRAIVERGAKLLAKINLIPNLSVAVWAHSRMSWQLAKVAAAEPADLYIAHCLAALPAAAIAAQRHGAKLGFDAEDFHIGELPETSANAAEIAVREVIERTLLPRCEHLTAASPGIAKAYLDRYGVKMEPILNVFPLAEAPLSPGGQSGNAPASGKSSRVGVEPSLYWFSQTIGPGRGIESIIRAMGLMRMPVRLHLRGFSGAGYREQLEQLARDEGVGDRVHLLSSAPPAEMAKLAACHDVGLSLELNQPLNRAICLTNKIFVYLLAGLPVLMSRTPAQEEFAGQLGEAAVLVDINNSQEIAMTLDGLFYNPSKLQRARATAWKLGRERYNWDLEQHRFLSLVERALK